MLSDTQSQQWIHCRNPHCCVSWRYRQKATVRQHLTASMFSPHYTHTHENMDLSFVGGLYDGRTRSDLFFPAHTDASAFVLSQHIKISTESMWNINSVHKRVCLRLCVQLLLWSLSLFSETAPGCLIYSKMPSCYPGVSGRKREGEKEKVKNRNCHSRFIYILLWRCVRPVIPTHSTYPSLSGLNKQISYSLCCRASFQDYPLWQS